MAVHAEYADRDATDGEVAEQHAQIARELIESAPTAALVHAVLAVAARIDELTGYVAQLG